MDKTERQLYDKVHQWLKHHFPHTTECEMPGCTSEGLRMEWSLLRGRPYEKKRENFWQLCASCHRKYDWTPEQSRKISEALRQRVYSDETRAKMSRSRIGHKMPQETRQRIAAAARLRWAKWREVGYSPSIRDPKTGKILPKN